MGFLSACTWHRRTRGMKPCGNVGPGGWDRPMKILGHFIHFYPLKKSNFSPVWHGHPSSCLPFEHPGTKMGSLDFEPVHSTLHPSFTSTCSTSTHFSTAYEAPSCSVQLLMARTVLFTLTGFTTYTALCDLITDCFCHHIEQTEWSDANFMVQ